jgi:similar to stage IV sporulation protein
MKEMSDFSKYKNGVITIEIQSLIPERFINLLWKKDVQIKKIKKNTITTMTMEISLKDYGKVEECARITKAKVKVVGRRGFTFLWLKLRKRTAFVFGIGLFACILYFLSTFIWVIEIVTDKTLSPYEIRRQLYEYGIKPGINKNNLHVYTLEEKMQKGNEDIMWIKIRHEGSKLKVSVLQRQSPPAIIAEGDPCNVIAKRDGVVEWVYSTAGTSIVKNGAIVKKGQVLIKGEQGKEGSTYQVHAKGNVVAKTFYEESKDVQVAGTKTERTGKTIENSYIQIKDKKIYFKNSINKFNNYDKIISNKLFIKKETYYELKEVPFKLDTKKVIEDTSNELYNSIILKLDKSIKVLSKVVEAVPSGDNYNIRVAVIAEENIAVPEKIQ